MKILHKNNLLVIDIGNTTVHCGLFAGNSVLKQFKINIQKRESNSFIDVRKYISKWEYDSAVIGSVVPDLNLKIAEQLNKPAVIVNNKMDLGLKIKYKKPDKVGVDRIANAVAAKYLYVAPSFIVDFGTAVTIDVISKTGDYIGGVICPGLEMIRRSLHEKTALLPLVEISKPKKILGLMTEEAIASGMYYGIRYMIEGLINALKKELHLPFKTAIIITGGNAELLGKNIGIIDNVLTLKGLKIIYERNKRL